MTHLNVEQNNNVEIVSSNIIQKLYDIALATVDASLSGNLQVDHCYRKSVEYLRNRFEDLNINVTGDYYAEIEDPIFKSIVNQVVGGGSDVTESLLASYTGSLQNLCIRCSNTQVKVIDLTPFTQAASLYSVVGGNAESNTMANVILDKLDFGNIEYITMHYAGHADSIYSNFNLRIATNSYTEVFNGERVKVIGNFMFRGLIVGEMYLPNIEWMAGGLGLAKTTISGTEYNRKFIFLGDKLLYMNIPFADENASNNGIIVITNPTPPVMGGFNVDNYPHTFVEDTALVSKNLYKFSAYDYYVPDDALATYKAANNWKDIEPKNVAGHIYPISQLPNEYKAKIAKWYTIPE